MSFLNKESLVKDKRVNERVVAIVRHHWFILIRDTIGIFVLFLLPFFLVPFVITAIGEAGLPLEIPAALGAFFGTMWALLAWHLWFMRWTDYYFDVWVITNLRIIDVDQIGLFHRDTTTLLDLDHIQDINTQVVGLIGSLLNYGTLRLQTAAAQQEFLIDDVPNPQKVERTIRDTQLEHAHRKIGGSPLH